MIDAVLMRPNTCKAIAIGWPCGCEPLRRQAKGFGELAREDLVADHEHELENVRLREVLAHAGEARVRHVGIIGNQLLAQLERGLLTRAETGARAPSGKRA